MYGSATLDECVEAVRGVVGEVDALQSEHEGEIVRRLHAARGDGTTGVVVNPGALGHYSYALRDALELVTVPKVEVHLSQTHAREPFRHASVISAVVDVTITGARLLGYRLAALWIVSRVGRPHNLGAI